MQAWAHMLINLTLVYDVTSMIGMYMYVDKWILWDKVDYAWVHLSVDPIVAEEQEGNLPYPQTISAPVSGVTALSECE